MLKEIRNAHFARRLTLLGWRHHLLIAERPSETAWGKRSYRTIKGVSAVEPVPLYSVDGRTYWTFEERFFWEDEALAPEDLLALVRDRARRQRRKIERAHAALAADAPGAPRPEPRREQIARELRLAVFQRDGGRCVNCGSNFEIQYDHVIPVALGGASTLENLQILCADCNREKGAGLR